MLMTFTKAAANSWSGRYEDYVTVTSSVSVSMLSSKVISRNAIVVGAITLEESPKRLHKRIAQKLSLHFSLWEQL
jgi:hypothetical protein